MVFKQGGWIWAIFGILICLLPSIVSMALVLPSMPPNEQFFKTVALFILFFIWGLAGIFLIFLRREKVIDRRRQQVVDRWNLLWLSRTKLYPLQAFKLVGLSRHNTPYDDVYDHWVCVIGSHHQTGLTVYLEGHGNRHDRA
jgi:hypothetical protein